MCLRKKICFNSLLSDKSNLSKGKEIIYNQFSMQQYFMSGNKLNSDTNRKILKVRTHDVAIRGNFKGQYLDIKCQIPGCNQDETQFHVFQSFCVFTSSVQRLKNTVQYNDIFQNNVSSQALVANVIFDNLIKRTQIIPAPSDVSEGPEEPRMKGGAKKKLSASPNLVIRKARVWNRNQRKQ